jgi:hypothetical protein
VQVDSLEQALLAALPLGPQADAGGVSLPELFRVSRAAAGGPLGGVFTMHQPLLALCCTDDLVDGGSPSAAV